jgi:hypothetical protein
MHASAATQLSLDNLPSSTTVRRAQTRAGRAIHLLRHLRRKAVHTKLSLEALVKGRV